MISMRRTISALEEIASVRYEGRAKVNRLRDKIAMQTGKWRERFEREVDNSTLSMRAISLAAGLGPGYVHSVIKEGKDPTIENLIKVCDVLNVSTAYVLHGLEFTPNEAQILELIRKNPARRDAILSLFLDQEAS